MLSDFKKGTGKHELVLDQTGQEGVVIYECVF